jgi:polyisoprenoid-binding protein YceI
MIRLIISLFLVCYFPAINAQQYLTKEAEISFFSKAPIEDISAKNNKVSGVYDAETKQLVFQLNISDFIFPKSLMQEHFNENYLESDKFPKASFLGDVDDINEELIATGILKIHGESNEVEVKGSLVKRNDSVMISATFTIQLKDYDIKIPKIVMYNIAEEIEVTIKAKLKEI